MGSAPSDSLSTGSEEGSAGDSSTSTAYNASLKPLKALPPGQPGDLLPAEAILEQFDRAQQYVLKNKGEFTAEQQAKLQVQPELLIHMCATDLCAAGELLRTKLEN